MSSKKLTIQIISFTIILLHALSCNKEEQFPILDTQKKIKEVHHITWWGEKNDLIKTLEVFTFNYDANGYLLECHENEWLLYKCIYENSILASIETGFIDGVATGKYDIKYSDDRVSQVIYNSIPYSEYNEKFYYSYPNDFELIRIDSLGSPGDWFWNEVSITEDRFSMTSHYPEQYQEGINNYSQDFDYTNIPNFYSSFQLPILPLPILLRPFGMFIPSEIMQIATHMPADSRFNRNIFETYSYEFNEGLVQKINVHNVHQNEPFDVVLFWE